MPPKRARTGNFPSETKQKIAKRDLIQAGNVGSILAEAISPTGGSEGLSDNEETLIGKSPSRDHNASLHAKLVLVSTFIRQHQYYSAAAASYNDPNVTSPPDGDTGAAVAVNAPSYYKTIIEDFGKMQLERQIVGLRTNTNRETSEGSNHVILSHAEALQFALGDAQKKTQLFLSEASLCRLHSKVCPSIDQSGRFRTRGARASRTKFCAADKISDEMKKLSEVMQKLHSKWISSKPANEEEWTAITYHEIALSAIWMFGLCGIHPFQDGNGRTARIYCNFVLKKVMCLPFSVTFVATAQQRSEYIEGLRHALSALTSTKNQSGAGISIFGPLINLILDRIVHAIKQVQVLLLEKSRVARNEEEARIARQVRERAAEQQCIICLDENPNVSTLCCGQVVHMSCLAEWLAQNPNCIGCRKPMSRANRCANAGENDANAGVVAAPAEEAARNTALQVEEHIDTTDEINDDEETTTADNYDSASDDNDATETVEDTTEHRTTVDLCAHGTCRNKFASDCPNRMCGQCCSPHGQNTCPRHEVTDSATTEDTSSGEETMEDTTVDDNISEDTTTEDTLCAHGTCRNIFSSDCPNQMCGQCCSPHGQSTCSRHGVADNATTEDTSSGEEAMEDTTVDDNISEDTTTEDTLCAHGTCRNIFSSDCPNQMCGQCCSPHGQSTCSRHGVTENATTEDTSSGEEPTEDTTVDDDISEDTMTEAAVQQSLPTFCRVCRQNRSAVDCENMLCGGCCQLHGVYGCARHNR